MLAIAARSFDAPSATFIRDHIRIVAPGRTVLICEDESISSFADATALTAVNRDARSLIDRWRRLRQGRGAGLPWPERRRVAAFLEARGVRAVLAEYGTTGIDLLGPCRMADVPLYVHFHGADATRRSRRRKLRRAYDHLFEDAAGIVVPSSFLGECVTSLGCPPDKLHVSPNGIDPQLFQTTRREPGRVLAVGRLITKKAPHLTIRAFAEVKRAVPHARLDVVGDGPLMDVCRGTSQKLGLNEAITFHGAQPSATVRALLEQASVFAQHSVTTPDGETESFGVSLVEAMASEVPVVATRHNGFADTVADGRTGCLVAEHDVAGMAAAIIDLLEDSDKAARMGAAGRTRVLDHFTHDHVAHRLRHIMGFEPGDRPTCPDGDLVR
jgi:glycosyltransferase involved in cell wall biosynthesis